MRRVLAAASVLVAFAATGVAHAGHTWVVAASPRNISIGGFRVLGGGVLPSYRGAITVFGVPQACNLRPFAPGHKPATNFSHVRWTTLGIQADFITYGVIAEGGDACSKPEGVQLSTLTIAGPNWHTDRGLKVGDTVARVQQLYPTALPHGKTFWIITRKSVVGAVSTGPVFSVTIRGGRVSSMVFAIGAEGD